MPRAHRAHAAYLSLPWRDPSEGLGHGGGSHEVGLGPLVALLRQLGLHLVGLELTRRDLLGVVAGHPVVGGYSVDLDHPQLRPLGVALRLLPPRAAGVEAAA